MFIRSLALATLAGTALVLPVSAWAAPFTVTDVAGRQVEFDGPVDRVILGEGACSTRSPRSSRRTPSSTSSAGAMTS